MKKLVSLLTVLAMLLCCCAFAEEADSIIGTWYLMTFVYEEQEFVASELGQSMELGLAEDGTMYMTYNTEKVEGNWTLDGTKLTLSVAGEAGFECTYEGDKIVIEQEGGKLNLTREVPAETYVPGEEIAVEDAAAFNGTWIACFVKVDTMVISLSAFDASLTTQGYTMADFLALMGLPTTDFTMTDGKATFTDATDELLGEVEGEFADGKMTLGLTSVLSEEPVVVTLTMLDSGDMALDFGEESGMTIYFEAYTGEE